MEKINQNKELIGKVAIITRATSGMGREIAQDLALQGVKVVINGQNKERGKKVTTKIMESEENAIFVQGNVSLP